VSGIQVFEFGGRKVRTTGTFEAPLFCAEDVCAILTLGDVSRACERLDQDEVVLTAAENSHERVGIGTGKRVYKRLYVTESGLFALILGCVKPEAKAFRKWVTSEVLPEIRKRGYYNALEVQRRKQTELLLGEIFPNLPSKAAPIFRELIGALLKLRRESDLPGTPAWARMLASWVYAWAIPVEGQQQHRRALNANPNGSRLDHSMLSEDAREQVKRIVDTGVHFTRISANWEAWRSNMELAFGKHAQLPLWYPALPGSEDPEAAE
jgi:prophage antirepressor-like protein